MAQTELRKPENVEGDFFVDSTCIDCDLCRQIAPTVFRDDGDQSIVYSQPRNAIEEFQALKALVTCPTASIGDQRHRSARQAVAAYPELIEDNVYFCGFAAESSFGASSYLVVRPGGNVLIDSPRFNQPLVRQIDHLGGIRWMLCTHRDDVADHARWAQRFGLQRLIHKDDQTRQTASVERVIEGNQDTAIDNELVAIPTPGHTPGHVVFLYRDKYLFTGDHLWWSDARRSLTASRSVCWYSWTEQTDSVEKLLKYDFEWVLPGHGRRAHASREQMKAYIAELASRMKGRRERSASWAE
jgi:glyoxylase-like metal-dependent hydrolase (beta-lactamase superfamily II)/ferredoxin